VNRRAITPSADTGREVPAAEGARIDRIDAALASLRDEERRLERLGLDGAVARCREQRRYWEFLRTLFTMPRDLSERRAA
jgi:hypothetical protein